MVETINKLIRVSRQLLQELGREPTPEEIAEEMDDAGGPCTFEILNDDPGAYLWKLLSVRRKTAILAISSRMITFRYRQMQLHLHF